MSWSRRRVLRAGGALACVSATALLARPARGQADTSAAANRRIALLNLHTGERLEIEYCRDGAYLPQALAAIENCLRDFRTGERHPDGSAFDGLPWSTSRTLCASRLRSA